MVKLRTVETEPNENLAKVKEVLAFLFKVNPKGKLREPVREIDKDDAASSTKV